MGSENEIQKVTWPNGGPAGPRSGQFANGLVGSVPLFVECVPATAYEALVAVRKADQERIARAEGYVEYFRKQVGDLKQSLAAAEKLADAVEQSGGVAPGPGPIGSALAAFRASLSTGEREQEKGEAGLIAPGVTKNDGGETDG